MHYVIARVELLIGNSETNASISWLLFVLFVFPLIVGLVYLYNNIYWQIEMIIKRM